MTDIERRALASLRAGPKRASSVGWDLWGHQDTGRGEGSHLNNKYCRAAGRVLARLRAAGLAESNLGDRAGIYWRLTTKGGDAC